MKDKDRQKLSHAMDAWMAAVERRTDAETVAKAARERESDANRALLALFAKLADTPQEPAPATPLRNCDVGTDVELDARFAIFCKSHECAGCPVAEKWEAMGAKPDDAILSCGLVWGQLPYEPPEDGGAEAEGVPHA